MLFVLGCAGNDGSDDAEACATENACGSESSDTGDGDGDPSSGDGDGDGDSTSGDGDPSSGDGDGDPITYTTIALPSGLDRVVIDRHDPNDDTCTRVVLASPLDLMNLAISTPPNWSIESASIHQSADCTLLGSPMPFESGTGSIVFLGLDQSNLYPCAIDVDITFDVNGNPPTLEFKAMNLAVVNC